VYPLQQQHNWPAFRRKLKAGEFPAGADRAGQDYYRSYLVSATQARHNARMGLDMAVLSFFQRIAVGAGSVLVLLLLLWLKLPRRSAISARRTQR
jgi:hypothetical protein